jgi:hypothetical protein
MHFSALALLAHARFDPMLRQSKKSRPQAAR